MTFYPLGDSALLINFEQKIDPEINARVMGLARSLKERKIRGVREFIPAYCSLTVQYDPLILGFDELINQIEGIPDKIPVPEEDRRVLKLPVCYEEPYALDLPEVEKLTGLAANQIIEQHSNTTFLVYMLGFLPGFSYLGSLPETLYCPRKTTPRLKVPARSIGLAGLQTGIYPSEAPGGWQIIGRTPVDVFRAEKADPFLIHPGDQVRFHSISAQEFESIEKQVASGSYQTAFS